MQDLIAKAETLLEALPYIQRFRSQTFVVKYGGSFMDSPEASVRNGVARDIVFLEAVGINPVVVHGGGKAITRAMEAAGLKAQFVQGQRVTDQATVDVVDRVLSREINPEIVKTIGELGGKARGFCGADIFKCRPLRMQDASGGNIELGFVGEVTSVNVDPLRECIHPGDQPHGAGRGRQDLQLQRGRGGGAGGDCVEGEAAGVHERCAGTAARPARP
jgi:acetylglutamate kinase